jgi:hypothetical protein
MLELIIYVYIVITVYSFPQVFLYISNLDSGMDEDGCGVSLDRGCESLSYVFSNRFNDSSLEKSLLLSDGYDLSENGGVVRIDGDTPCYYIFGANYKLNITSTVIIGSNQGCFICRKNIHFSHIVFESENGEFNYSVADEDGCALILADLSGVEVVIERCDFITNTGYNFDIGSSSCLIHAFKGACIILKDVVIERFKNNGGIGAEFIRIGDESENTFPRTEIWLVGVNFNNLKTISSAVIEIKNGLVNLENSTFLAIDVGDKTFMHAYISFFVVFFD